MSADSSEEELGQAEDDGGVKAELITDNEHLRCVSC